MRDRQKLPDPAELIETLGLEAHPEGGRFRRIYTAPTRDPSGRATAGSIYFLLQGRELSHFHRIDCDELWYYHLGCGMRITCIDPDGALRTELLGSRTAAGERPTVILPAGTVFAAENLDPEGFTLAGCMTTPQFRYEGFTLFSRAELLELWPAHAEAIRRLAMEDPHG